jgi:hypothetical protein
MSGRAEALPPRPSRPWARVRRRMLPGSRVRAARLAAPRAAAAAGSLAVLLTMAGPAPTAGAAPVPPWTRATGGTASATAIPPSPARRTAWRPLRWTAGGPVRVRPAPHRIDTDHDHGNTSHRGAHRASGAILDGVSCSAPSQCTATGRVIALPDGRPQALAERWNGRRWTVQVTPTPRSGQARGGGLTAGVACPAVDVCVAAGVAHTTRGPRLLAEGWNGTRWVMQRGGTPGQAVLPHRIVCPGRADCLLVGQQQSGLILAEHWNGRAWAAQPTQRAGALLGVSCAASHDCTAVGFTLQGSSLAEHWNGRAWAAQPFADPQPYRQLIDVSCPSASYCMAVGTAGLASAAPISERWTGSKWSAVRVPEPAARDSITEFTAVSCTSPVNCMAVGDSENAAGTGDTAITAHWDGTTWQVEATPRPARFTALLSVACPSASYCLAVGSRSASPAGPASPLAEVWNGTRWAVQSAAV